MNVAQGTSTDAYQSLGTISFPINPANVTTTMTLTEPTGFTPGPGTIRVTARGVVGCPIPPPGQAGNGNDVFHDDIAVTKGDVTPPVISSVSADSSVLWPPNHKMRSVAVAVVVSDNSDPSPSCSIISVGSDEPVSGKGAGNTSPDWEVTGDSTVDLRAERSGKGDGRVYTIEVDCSDASGNTSTSTTEVTVPHDQS